MRKEVGSAGKTNQNLPRIEFTFDDHLKLPTPCPSPAGQEFTCQNLPKNALPINNHKYSFDINVCSSQLLLRLSSP